MNTFDPTLQNRFSPNFDYNREIDQRMKELESMRDSYNKQIHPQENNNSLWNKIDLEIQSLTTDQRNILFSAEEYIRIDNQLKALVQEALINSVKGVIENSEVGNKLLNQQLNLIRNNKDRIIAEANKEVEVFKKFQIAAKTNPQLTYADFIKSITE